MSATDRWRDGKIGLVHQLVRLEEKKRIVEAPYFGGSISAAYGTPVDRITVRWLPRCGIRRKKDLRQGRHNGCVTCLTCLGT